MPCKLASSIRLAPGDGRIPNFGADAVQNSVCCKSFDWLPWSLRQKLLGLVSLADVERAALLKEVASVD